MTEYANWTHDFPGRAMSLYKQHLSRARQHGLDVTLLLTVASAVIIIPRERGRSDHGLSNHATHRGLDVARLENALGSPIKTNHALTPDQKKLIASIRYGTCDGGRPDWRPDSTSGTFGDGKCFRTLVKHLRNALAHGNLATRGRPIEEVVFFTQRYKGGDWNFVQLEPKQLEAVLECWMSVLDLVHDRPDGPDILGRYLDADEDGQRDAA